VFEFWGKTASKGLSAHLTPTSGSGSSGLTSLTPMAITLDQVRRVVSDTNFGDIETFGGLKIIKYDGSMSADAIAWFEFLP